MQQHERRAFTPLDQVDLTSVAHGDLAVHDVVGHGELRVGRGRALVGPQVAVREREGEARGAEHGRRRVRDDPLVARHHYSCPPP